MFNWLKVNHRDVVRMRSFSSEWESFLYKNVVHYGMLDSAERTELRALTLVLLEEKFWEGCGGLDLTDEIRITIAAQASLLLLGLPHDYYRNVESILVYPSTIVIPERIPGVFARVSGPVASAIPVLGLAIAGGAVVLVWDAVKRGARHPELGHNVVYHEFAHKLDMLEGAADGTPPLADRNQLDEWVTVCSREFKRLKVLAEKGKKTFLDPYGASNEAEFFAVATEEFFDRPQALLTHAPDLYNVLGAYYRQDPAVRVSRFSPGKE